MSKPLKTWGINQSNPFNTEKFKGFNEKINDWDLERTIYIYEPQSLAELGDEASELDYQRVWSKFRDGGHINVFLVPYREAPTVKVSITSLGADWDGLTKSETIAGYTNVMMGDRPTKRFYSFEPLTASEDPINLLEIFEDNNLAETVNNDGTFKQTTFTLNKFEPYDGGEESYYRDVKFFYGIYKPDNIQYIQVEHDVPSIIGGTVVKGNKGNSINKEIAFSKEVARGESTDFFQAGRYVTDWQTGNIHDLDPTSGTDETYVSIDLEDANDIDVHFTDIDGNDLGKEYTLCGKVYDSDAYPYEILLTNLRLDIDEDGKGYIKWEYYLTYESGGSCPVDALDYIQVRLKFTRNDKISFLLGNIEEGSTEITYPEDATVFPHLIVPRLTENGINWMVPWSWEYMYANEQIRGKYSVTWLDNDGDEGTQGGESVEYEPPSSQGKGVDMTGEYLFNRESSYVPYYVKLTDSNISETGKEAAFFLPYMVQFGLPRGLSAHGTIYVNSSISESTGLLNNFNYTDGSHNGARVIMSQSGPWATKSTMMAWDLAYDPSVLSIAGRLDMYLSEIKYGKYYMSTAYAELINSILDENPVYDGTAFNSNIGILEDVSNQSVNRDIRQWDEDGDWTMGLLPLDIVDLTQSYTTENPKYLDSTVYIGQESPKIDLGLLDTKPAILRTNATSPFFGKYIEDSKIAQYPELSRTLLFSTEDNDASQLLVNYYAFDKGNITIKFFTEVDGLLVETYSTTELNERAQGRNLSGGTIFTWI